MRSESVGRQDARESQVVPCHERLEYEKKYKKKKAERRDNEKNEIPQQINEEKSITQNP